MLKNKVKMLLQSNNICSPVKSMHVHVTKNKEDCAGHLKNSGHIPPHTKKKELLYLYMWLLQLYVVGLIFVKLNRLRY